MEFQDPRLEERFNQFKRTYGETAFSNHKKVLEAFHKAKIDSEAFNGSTGYGYADFGRRKLNELYSAIFRSEDALVSSKFASGTHAIYTALRGIVRPGDRIVSLTGALYDTLEKALWNEEGLVRRDGVLYEKFGLTPSGHIDLEAIRGGCLKGARVAMIQRSRGYSQRKAVTVEEIGEAVALIRLHAPGTLVFVDNCYGEFVEDREPIEVGADLAAGSLIKNPGGTIAVSGGYIVGRAELIERIASAFTVPGIGREIGCESSTDLRLMFQGIYLAPKLVEESLLTAYYAALVLEKAGYEVSPDLEEKRSDLIQSVIFHDQGDLIRFVQLIQRYSPVDSMASPEPWDMPGYDHQVIMASGSFIGGSSSELSADGPIRPPFVAYLQGGVSFHYSKLAIDKALEGILE